MGLDWVVAHLGIHAAETCQVSFEDLQITCPASQILFSSCLLVDHPHCHFAALGVAASLPSLSSGPHQFNLLSF